MDEVGTDWALVTLQLPPMDISQRQWYLCLRETPSSRAIHQGSVEWLSIITYTLPLPIWVQVSCICIFAFNI